MAKKITAQSATASKDPKRLLEKVFADAKVSEAGYLDPYSLTDVDLFGLVRMGAYAEIVDWSCVFETIYRVFDDYKATEDDLTTFRQDSKKLAMTTHRFLSSLPLEYHFMLPLPTDHPKLVDGAINSKVKIVTMDENTRQPYLAANPQPASPLGLFDAINTRNTEAALPAVDETYLSITCHGYVGDIGPTVHEQDPIYIYKIYIALLVAIGYVDQKLRPRDPTVRGFAFRAYLTNHEFVSSIARPVDEARMVNSLTFQPDVTAEQIEKTLRLMDKLLSRQNSKENEKLRNQIVNSLFWFFEMSKTDNPNMKSVFFTSVFDSFFAQDEKANTKAQIISLECSETAQQQEDARIHIKELYESRNSIIHGERPLLDYQVEGMRKNKLEESRTRRFMVKYYDIFLTRKIERYNKSVPM